jgi:hypothetical protein
VAIGGSCSALWLAILSRPEGAVVFAASLAGPLVTVEGGSAVSTSRDIGQDQKLLMLPSNCHLF